MNLTWLLAFLALTGFASLFYLKDNNEQIQARADVSAIAYLVLQAAERLRLYERRSELHLPPHSSQ